MEKALRKSVAGLALAAGLGVGIGAYLLLRPPPVKPYQGGGIAVARDDDGGRTGTGLGPDGGGLRADLAGRSVIQGVVRLGAVPAPARIAVVGVADPGAGRALFDAWLAEPITPASAVATTEAGEDGRYAVSGLAAGMYLVFATGLDGSRTSVTAIVGAEGARVEANPTLPGCCETLRARVIHEDGRPWTGRVVVTDPSPSLSDPLGRVLRGESYTPDADGRVTITGLGAGEVRLVALQPGLLRSGSSAIAIPFNSEFTFVVDAGSPMLSGRVLAEGDGGAVTDAVVFYGGVVGDASVWVSSTTTDRLGRFELRAKAGSGPSLFAAAPGYAPVQRHGVDPRRPVEMRLPAAARLKGRVTSAADGTAVEGVTVRLVYGGTRVGREAPGTFATATDPDGQYALVDLPPGEATVVVEGGPWHARGAEDLGSKGYDPLLLTLDPGAVRSVDVVVEPGAVVTGTVRAADGAPVAGALVRAEAEGLGTHAAAFRAGASATAGDGTYLIRGLAALPYRLVADAPGFATVRSPSVEADLKDPRKVDLAFPAERRVEVSLVDDETGAPLEGATVRIVTDDDGRVEEATFPTGKDGKAWVGPIGAGAVRVSAAHDDYVPLAERRLLPHDATVSGRMRRGLAVRGVVLTPDRSPASAVRVWAEALTKERAAYGLTEPDGSFVLRGLPPGDYDVRVSRATGADGSLLAGSTRGTAGGGPVTIVLAPDATSARAAIVVRVVDADGRPVPRAILAFRTARRTTRTEVRDGTVTLSVDESDRGLAELRVSNAVGATGSPLSAAPVRVTGIELDAGEVVVRMPRGHPIVGVVRGPDGKGVQGAIVSASDASPDSSDASTTPLSAATTDAAGAFRLEGLGSDEVTISVAVSAAYVAPEPVTARGGGVGVEFELRPAVPASVTVLDWAGKPTAGAEVRARDLEDPARPLRAAAVSDAKGLARLGSLDRSRTYSVSIAPPSARSDLLPGTLKAWTPTDATATLERGFTLEVRIVDLSGRPVSQAMLWQQKPGGAWSSEPAGDEGRVTLRRLPAGSVWLIAAPEGVNQFPTSPDPRVARTRAKADQGLVELRIDPGQDLVVRVEGAGARGERGWRGVLHEEVDASESTTPLSLSSSTPDGVLRWRGLKPGMKYTLWIPPEEGGTLSCLKRGVVGGTEVAVRLTAGRTISGRVFGPAGTGQFSVQAAAGRVTVDGRVEATGHYEITGLPDGVTWRLFAAGRQGETWYTTATDAEMLPGGTMDIDLRRVPGR